MSSSNTRTTSISSPVRRNDYREHDHGDGLSFNGSGAMASSSSDATTTTTNAPAGLIMVAAEIPHVGGHGGLAVHAIEVEATTTPHSCFLKRHDNNDKNNKHGTSSTTTSSETTTPSPTPPFGVHDQDEEEQCNGNNKENSSSTNQFQTQLIFVLFVLFGTGNAVLGKLVMKPMYNYPVFLNLWICALYCVVCFIYVVPAFKFKWIPLQQLSLPKTPFAIMAIFDTIFGIMVMMAATYLPGPLLVLLAQATIPFSMLLSRIWLKTTYAKTHYMGALLVLLGIAVVLEPLFSKRHVSSDPICVANPNYMEEFCVLCEDQFSKEDCLALTVEVPPSSNDNNRTTSALTTTMTQRILTNDKNHHTSFVNHLPLFDNELQSPSSLTTTSACLWETEGTESNVGDSSSSLMILWSFGMILSTIPLTMSSIYKEQYNSHTDIDPILINLWIGLFQTLYSIPLSIPAGYASSPPVPFDKLMDNFYNGLKCFVGIPSITTGCHPDVACPFWGPLSTIAFFVVNAGYSVLMILILKYGTANLMFLALTLTIPLSNLCFALPFMPNPSVMHVSDITGLVVIMMGLMIYRFGSYATKFLRNKHHHHGVRRLSSNYINDLLLQEGLLEMEEHQSQSTTTMEEPLL